MRDLINFTDKYYLIGSSRMGTSQLKMDQALEHSGQYLCYNHFSPEPFDYLKRRPEMAYNEIIREHEAKPGIYRLHPTESPQDCPKEQMQFIFFAILLSSDTDRAFITLLRIMTRFMFWQDWRKTHLKAFMLPSDISPLVRTLIKGNKKYLVLYPILVLGDFMLTFTSLWTRIRRKHISRSRILNLHAKLASSRHIPTVFTYLNNWIYQFQAADLAKFYGNEFEPPIAGPALYGRYLKHNADLSHTQKNLAYLGIIVHILSTFALSWALYLGVNKLTFPTYDLIKKEAISKIC